MSNAEIVYQLAIAQIRTAIQTIASDTEVVVVPAHMDDLNQMIERTISNKQAANAPALIHGLEIAVERLIEYAPAGMAIPMAKDVARLAAQLPPSVTTTGKRRP